MFLQPLARKCWLVYKNSNLIKCGFGWYITAMGVRYWNYFLQTFAKVLVLLLLKAQFVWAAETRQKDWDVFIASFHGWKGIFILSALCRSFTHKGQIASSGTSLIQYLVQKPLFLLLTISQNVLYIILFKAAVLNPFVSKTAPLSTTTLESP